MLKKYLIQYQAYLWGALASLGFAPIQKPVFLYLALLCFFSQLQTQRTFKNGLLFGAGLASFGLSWIYVSIHSYGHLNPLLSGLLTSLFIAVIGSFYGLFVVVYARFYSASHHWLNPWVLASSWCCLEWIRAHLFGGFPWLIIGFASVNTPFAKLLPILGLYGPSFALTLATASLVAMIHRQSPIYFALLGIGLFFAPGLIHLPENTSRNTIDLGVIQGNVKMEDKWNEEHFWQQFNRYFLDIQQLLAPKRLIVLPEAAISIPRSFVHQELRALHHLAKTQNSAILLGIPEGASQNQNEVYNSLLGLGQAIGDYKKQQLVLFGEEIPRFWHRIFQWLHIPIVTTLPGQAHQTPIRVFGYPIASLICYELGYPEVLRPQLPQAQWIVSISDDGWFGRSFAVYQHLQMAQTLSMMAQRPQLFVNNNGLSSIISAQGTILHQLPAWHSGKLIGKIQTRSTQVPWMKYGDLPMKLILLFIFTLTQLLKPMQWYQRKLLRT